MRRLYRIQDVLMVPFDREMMTTPWDDFIVRILVGRYHAVHLVAGHDHHFGHRNQGTPELLAQKGAQLGLGCDIIPKVEVADVYKRQEGTGAAIRQQPPGEKGQRLLPQEKGRLTDRAAAACVRGSYLKKFPSPRVGAERGVSIGY